MLLPAGESQRLCGTCRQPRIRDARLNRRDAYFFHHTPADPLTPVNSLWEMTDLSP